jgi:hypothetical protein
MLPSQLSFQVIAFGRNLPTLSSGYAYGPRYGIGIGESTAVLFLSSFY